MDQNALLVSIGKVGSCPNSVCTDNGLMAMDVLISTSLCEAQVFGGCWTALHAQRKVKITLIWASDWSTLLQYIYELSLRIGYHFSAADINYRRV